MPVSGSVHNAKVTMIQIVNSMVLRLPRVADAGAIAAGDGTAGEPL